MELPTLLPVLAAALALGYLLGSFPTALVASRLARKTDPRDAGSGNLGATNAVRTLGFRWGLAVGLVDILKGVGAVLVSQVILHLVIGPDQAVLPGVAEAGATIGNGDAGGAAGESAALESLVVGLTGGTAAILGHIFPLFAGFRGGKGVATAAGVLTALWPTVMVAPYAVFVLGILLTGYVSVGSMAAAVALPVCVALLLQPFGPGGGPAASLSFVICTVLAVLVIFLHRKNIQRLASGRENRFEKTWILRRFFGSGGGADPGRITGAEGGGASGTDTKSKEDEKSRD